MKTEKQSDSVLTDQVPEEGKKMCSASVKKAGMCQL
jgi:hypothetical protein